MGDDEDDDVSFHVPRCPSCLHSCEPSETARAWRCERCGLDVLPVV